MPRKLNPQNPTPWAQVLLDYMWSQRPPLNATELAELLGMPKPTVTNWFGRRAVPDLDTAMTVLSKLSIPLDRLVQVYREAGTPLILSASQPTVPAS
jgi:transcriptional regulator with XRE-family HTH domain